MCHHSDYYNKKVPDSIDKSVDKQLFKSSSRKYRLKMIRSSHSEKKVEETKGKKFYPQTQKKKTRDSQRDRNCGFWVITKGHDSLQWHTLESLRPPSNTIHCQSGQRSSKNPIKCMPGVTCFSQTLCAARCSSSTPCPCQVQLHNVFITKVSIVPQTDSSPKVAV